MHLYKRKNNTLWRWAAAAVVAVAAVALLMLGSGRMEQTADREQTELLAEAVNQAVVSCYAIEGRYPESLDYLIENYGIRVDTEKYVVTYEVFADNIRPYVRVIRMGETK